MLFTGQYEHTIDAKHRLSIPADIRQRWNTEQDGTSWYAVPWRQGLIRLYTQTDFHARAASRPLTLTPDEDEAELQASLFGLSAELEIDSAGRVRLPEDMLVSVSMPAEVVLVGAGDRLEIRSRAEWLASKQQRLAQLPELLSRISAKRSGGHPSA